MWFPRKTPDKMIHLLFYIRSKKKHSKLAFWKYNAASVYCWINKDDVEEAKSIVKSVMERKGYNIIKFYIAKCVPKEQLPIQDKLSMNYVRVAQISGSSYTFDRLSEDQLERELAWKPVKVTSRYIDIEGVAIDTKKVPQDLRPLLSCTKWAIGDDIERKDFIASVPLDEKKAFVDMIWPKMDELELFCEKFRDKSPVPDEVVLLDMIAQSATEAYPDVYPDQ